MIGWAPAEGFIENQDFYSRSKWWFRITVERDHMVWLHSYRRFKYYLTKKHTPMSVIFSKINKFLLEKRVKKAKKRAKTHEEMMVFLATEIRSEMSRNKDLYDDAVFNRPLTVVDVNIWSAKHLNVLPFHSEVIHDKDWISLNINGYKMVEMSSRNK